MQNTDTSWLPLMRLPGRPSEGPLLYPVFNFTGWPSRHLRLTSCSLPCTSTALLRGSMSLRALCRRRHWAFEEDTWPASSSARAAAAWCCADSSDTCAQGVRLWPSVGL